MNVLFIKIGNLIVQREKICSLEYREFNGEDAKLLGANSILYVRTADGNELKLKDDHAKQLWVCLESSAIDITPLEE